MPVATDDDHYDTMANDPSIREIPRGSNWNSMYAKAAYSEQQFDGYTMDPGQQGGQNYTPLMTAPADTNAASNAEILVKHSKESTDWINRRWRPAMGWMYMTVCIFDFILFPVMYTIVQFWETQASNDAFRQWQPLTLSGAGLFHMAMGAVLGIAAYGRTKEKVEGKA